MKISNKIRNKRASDPFDILIFEKGLRATDLIIYPKLDLLVVVLNAGKTLTIKISDYPRLKKATEKQLKKWTMIDNGTGFHWEDLDEDISLRGLMKTSAYNATLQNLSNNKSNVMFA